MSSRLRSLICLLLLLVGLLASAGIPRGLGGEQALTGPMVPAASQVAAALLTVSGELKGWLEPCGCAEGQVGGLARRAAWLERRRADLSASGGALLHLDTGDFTGSRGMGPTLLDLQTSTALSALAAMGCTAAAVGEQDLRLGVARLAELDRQHGVKLVCANLVRRGVEGAERYPLRRVVSQPASEALPLPVNVTAVIGESLKPAVESDPSLQWLDTFGCVTELLEAEGLWVILLHGSLEEAQRLGERLRAEAPALGARVLAIISGHGLENPPDPVIGPAPLVLASGHKGKRVLTLAVEPGAAAEDPPVVRWLGSPLLGPSIPDQGRVRALLDGYWAKVAQLGPEAVERRPVDAGGRFVGSQACAVCHEPAFAAWQRSGHRRAFTAMAKRDAVRARAPECLSCHTTGYRFDSGLRSPEQDPHLANMGCEMCHGVGSRHVETPEPGFGRPGQRALWKERCLTCHDGDNSPEFDFDRYMERIKHWPE